MNQMSTITKCKCSYCEAKTALEQNDLFFEALHFHDKETPSIICEAISEMSNTLFAKYTNALVTDDAAELGRISMKQQQHYLIKEMDRLKEKAA